MSIRKCFYTSMLLVFFFWIGLFNNTFIQKSILNKYISEDYIDLDSFIPIDNKTNILILLDSFIIDDPFGDFKNHGDLVYNNFKLNNKDDLLIIRLNIDIYNSYFNNFFLNQGIVNIYNENKISESYSYYDLIKYIVDKNPDSNVILSQSTNIFPIFIQNKNMVNNFNNLFIVKAMPYKENNSQEFLIELLGNYYDINDDKLLYINKCNDYIPTFSNNYKCSNENTSISTPILGYEFFKK